MCIRDRHGSLLRQEQAVDVLGKGGLAGAIMPQDGHEIAFLDIYVHMIQRPVDGFHILLLIPADIVCLLYTSRCV